MRLKLVKLNWSKIGVLEKIQKQNRAIFLKESSTIICEEMSKY